MPIAQLRCDRASGAWTLYWQDSRDRWHVYDTDPGKTDVGDLLLAIENDKLGVFWG